MQFTLKKPVAKQAPAVAPLRHVTPQDVLDVAEFNARLDSLQNKRIAHTMLAMNVCNSLTVASMLKQTGAIAKLGDDNLIALADAMGVSVEALNDMSMQDFSKRALALMPKGMVEASTEDVAVAIVAVAAIALFIAYLAGLVAMAGKVTKYEIPWLTRDYKEIIAEKGAQALKELGVNSWSAKQMTGCIKSIDEILKFLETDAKKLYDPKYPVVNIEKMALKLWAAPSHTVTSTPGAAGNAAIGYSGTIDWDGWRGNMPEKEFKTLGEHGWTMQSLEKFCTDLKALCKEIMTLGQRYGEVKRGAFQAKQQYNPGGFFAKVKRFFTESVEDREKRKQAELIINAKFIAMKNLVWGVDISGRTLIYNFYDICNKMEKYIVAEQKKASAAKPAPAKK